MGDVEKGSRRGSMEESVKGSKEDETVERFSLGYRRKKASAPATTKIHAETHVIMEEGVQYAPKGR